MTASLLWRDSFRYVLLILGFLCLTSICSNYIIINFTFICMGKDESEKIVLGNGTSVNRYDYSPAEKSLIIWAVAFGTILGTFPINYCYIKFGARWPFFISGLLSVCSTAVIPLAAHFGLPYLLFSRFIQGLAYAADFAAIGILCVRWAPLSQTCIFISVLTTFTPVSTVITNPLSGWLCDSSLGWRWAYYMHAVFGLFVFILWIIFYRDDPQLHPSVSAKELSEIQKDKTQAHIERDSFVPYKEIIKNRVILIVWFNAFTEMTTVTLLLVYAPIYFHKVLGYDIPTTGVLVSFAASIHLPLKFVGGIISDRITSVTERHKMWFFNSIAVGLAGVFCALIGVFPANWSKTGVALFTLVITCMGMNPGGFYKCGTLSSRQYAHFVLATIQFMKCVALFVGPAMVAVIVHDERRHDQWRYVYWINGILLILANFTFIPIATDRPASFTLITRATRNKNRRQIPNTEINDLEMYGKSAKNGNSASLRPTGCAFVFNCHASCPKSVIIHNVTEMYSRQTGHCEFAQDRFTHNHYTSPLDLLSPSFLNCAVDNEAEFLPVVVVDNNCC